MQQPPRVVISTLGLCRKDMTRQCLEAVLTHAPSAYVIATDNGSTDGTGPMMDALAARYPERMKVVHNTENRFFQEPHAAAFREAANMGAEFFLCLNDDTVPQPGFLEKLLAPFGDPMVALCGISDTCSEINHEFHGQPGRKEYVDGGCMMVRIEIIQQLRRNLWCPDLTKIYGDDSSLSLYIQEKGYKLAFVDMHLPHARSSTVNSNPEVKRLCMEAQEHNHKVNMARWGYYLEHRRFDLPIVVKRSYAIGDCILMEPIIRAIRKSRPLSPILVQCDFPELFANHPDVQQCAKSIHKPYPCLEVNLDGAYESQVNRHIVDCYWDETAKVITGLEPHDWRTHLHPSAKDQQWAEAKRAELGGDKLALLATDDTTWVSKNWPQDRMHQVAQWLIANGWTVAAIGSKNRVTPQGWRGVHSLVGETTLMQLAALCERANLMLSPCSSGLHIAQAMGCPTVGLFGITRARFITTQGSKCAAVECPDSIEGAGARHRVTGKTFVDVGTAVMEAISVEDVIAGVKKLEV